MYKAKRRRNKERIQKTFYSGINVDNATFIGGPFPKNNITLIKTIAKKGISYEISPEIRKKQAKYRQPNISFKLGNIKEALPTNFMDLDLMRTIETQYEVFIDIIKKQKKLKGEKYLLGTVSLRLVGIKTTIRLLNCILKALLNKHTLEYESYADKEGPMLAFKVTYK